MMDMKLTDCQSRKDTSDEQSSQSESWAEGGRGWQAIQEEAREGMEASPTEEDDDEEDTE